MAEIEIPKQIRWKCGDNVDHGAYGRYDKPVICSTPYYCGYLTPHGFRKFEAGTKEEAKKMMINDLKKEE